jgi:hypothetical protein
MNFKSLLCCAPNAWPALLGRKPGAWGRTHRACESGADRHWPEDIFIHDDDAASAMWMSRIAQAKLLRTICILDRALNSPN